MTKAQTPHYISMIRQGQSLSFGQAAHWVHEIENAIPHLSTSAYVSENSIDYVTTSPYASYCEQRDAHNRTVWQGPEYDAVTKLEARLCFVSSYIRHELDHNAREDIHTQLLGAPNTRTDITAQDFHDTIHDAVFHNHIRKPSWKETAQDIVSPIDGWKKISASLLMRCENIPV